MSTTSGSRSTPSQGPAEADAFLGRWAIERTITDRLGPDAGLTGTAEITKREGGAWDYFESGAFRIGDRASLAASRAYLWQPDGQGGIDILFDDGRFFHRLPLSGGTAGHDCAPDRYDVCYDFGHWPVWRAVWRVTGPRKDYVSDTTFAPLPLRSAPEQS